MRYFYALLITLFIGNLGFGQIISQYVETNSGSNPKGIEIWNNTGSTLDFATNNLVIEKGTNGATPSTDFTISSGTLASGAVLVIGTSDMETVTLANGSAFYLKAFTFNGDDALVVKYGGTITDMFGTAGTDPGSSWSGSGVSTADQNIELINSITTGDTDGWTDPSTRFSTVNTNPSGTDGDEGFGIAPSAPSANPTIGFGTATSTENETNTTFTSSNIPITVTNYDGNQIDIDITVTGGTAEPGDYTFTSPTSLSFTADGTQNITIDINADADFDDETVELTITETSSVTGLVISQATHTITILDDETPPLPNIVINEILADPSTDANGDGTVSATEDEFVELINNEIFAIDITGYTLSDGLSVRHTFGSVVIPAGGSVVVFGGGTPTGIQGISTVASNSGLGFNNGGDTVTLEDTSNNVVATYTYGGEGGNDQSIGRNEDIFGGFVQHTTIQTNPVAASPGLYNVSGLPFSTITWKGSIDTDWTNVANWSNGNSPTALDDILISNVANAPIIASTISVNNVTVNPGASLIISSSGSLSASTLNLFSFSNSFSSLISDGSITGTVTYNRYTAQVAPTGTNDLIASPFSAQTFGAFATANDGVLAASGTLRAFAPFNNNSNAYDNYDTSSNNETVITSGQGYRAGTINGGTLAFEGTLNNSNLSVPLTVGSGSFWNLIGNPYSSYMDTAAFLTANSANLRPAYVAIYGYNGDNSNGQNSRWTILDSNTAPNPLITPSQGFFVAAPDGGSSAEFTLAMRTTGSIDDFITGRNTTSDANFAHAILNLNTVSTSYVTNIYFRDINTLGLDPGYDTGAFDQAANGIYSHLVADNTGVALANQSLPFTSLSDISVPLVVNANAGEQLSFSLNTNSNIPDNINVYLEDQLAGSLTLLNSGAYVLTPASNLSGPGRFYLRFTDNALNINQQDLSTINLYTVDKELVIAGFLQHPTTATLFDIQGRAILSMPLDVSSQLQKIDMSPFTNGIYIVQLTNNITALSQKIILK